MTMYYSTGRRIPNEQLRPFRIDGTVRPDTEEYNAELAAEIGKYIEAIKSAVKNMSSAGLDMRSRRLQDEVNRILNPEGLSEETSYGGDEESLVRRFSAYMDDSHRDGIIGERRYAHYSATLRRLERFLHIKGLTGMSTGQFDMKMLMEYRAFIADEYRYVSLYPELYVRQSRNRYPSRRLSGNTVVHEMKGLKAFFNELERTDENFKSPFRRISPERYRAIMRQKYDEPFFLRKAELLRVLNAEVPRELQTARDIFVLNCCTGARIGDFLRFSMSRVSVSPEGIPYIHYIPRKTLKSMESVTEVRTPLVRQAYDIVMRTKFSFNDRRAGYPVSAYNKDLRKLLKLCGIDRLVAKFDETKGDNEYFPLHELAGSRLARKTHVDIMNKVQVNAYAAGLHAEGSDAVHRYTSLELEDRFALMNAAFGQKDYRVAPDLTLIRRGAMNSLRNCLGLLVRKIARELCGRHL